VRVLRDEEIALVGVAARTFAGRVVRVETVDDRGGRMRDRSLVVRADHDYRRSLKRMEHLDAHDLEAVALLRLAKALHQDRPRRTREARGTIPILADARNSRSHCF